jgi:alpha/beta superfamily hydrolase
LIEEIIINTPDGLRLVGVLHRPRESVGLGVVICHPHPLYGGNMENNVVVALAKHMSSIGLPAIRFNFRGVGRSEGVYSGGEGEVVDALSAADALMLLTGVERVLIAGYSFGAYVAAMAMSRRVSLIAGILVSPPNRLLDFGFIGGLRNRPILVVLGDRDQYSDPTPFQKVGVEVVVVRGADHFWIGREDEVCKAASKFVERLISGST